MNKELNWKIEPWNTIHSICIIFFSILTLFNQNLSILAFYGIISFLSYILINFRGLNKLFPFAGYANWATGARFMAFIVFLIFLLDYENKFLWCLILNSILVLDVFDGYLARKFNQSTKFGQFFDMEVDAFWVCSMCILYYLYFDIAWWILVPGVLRYFYKLFIQLFPKPNFQESRKKYAAYIAGTFFVILSSSMILNDLFLNVILGVGALMICVSFSISIIEYLKF